MIKALYRRSGLGVKDYAEAVMYSTPQVSNIINDKEPGSLKALLACLAHAKIDIQECLDLPEQHAETKDEKQLVRTFRALETSRKKTLLDVATAMLVEQPRRRKELR